MGLAAAWLALRDLRLRELAAVLAAIGPAAALVFLPQAVAMALDTLAWQRVLLRLGDAVRFVRLARARVASEFMAVALPAGALVADGTLSVVLSRWCGVRAPDAVAAVAARKLIVWRAHAASLLLAGLAAAAGLGSELTSRPAVVFSLLAASAAVGLASVLLALLAGTARPAARVRWLLLRVPSRRLRAALGSAEAHFDDADVRLAVAARTRALRAHALFVGCWLVRAVEPWLILHLAGAPPPYVDVLAAEALVGLVRSVAVAVPAGLGLQELGYSLYLRMAGAPDPAALTAALALLRRAREGAWAAAGYVLLWAGGGTPVAAPALPPAEAPEGRAVEAETGPPSGHGVVTPAD